MKLIITLAFVVCLLPFSEAFAESADQDMCKVPHSNNSIGKALKKVTKVIKRQGVTRLPPIRTSFQEYLNRFGSDLPHKGALGKDVSGTPPTLASLGDLATIKETFWRPGVIDAIASGSPEQYQCNEFYSGESDGTSGGMDACYLAQNVGFSFQDLLSSETTLCYLKSFPTKANVKSGGVTVVKGRLPNNDITKVFASAGRARTVQVAFGDELDDPSADSIFVRVASNGENKRNNLLYRVQVYFCQSDAEHPEDYDTIDVLPSGEISISLASQGDPDSNEGAYDLNVRGHLQPSGSTLGWDLSQSRTASLNSFSTLERTDGFKSTFNITPDNLIYTKTLNAFDDGNLKTYTITRFTGADISSVRFLEGGFKDLHLFENEPFTNASGIEYRDTFYAAAPNSTLAQLAQAYDMESDAYYTTPIEVNVDLTQFDCNVRPDVALLLDTSVPSLERALAPCEQEYLDNMDFCFRDATVQQAQDNYFNACTFIP